MMIMMIIKMFFLGFVRLMSIEWAKEQHYNFNEYIELR